MMRKSVLTGFMMFAFGMVVAGLLVPWLMPQGAAIAASSETYKQLDLFGRVFERVRSDYVEETKDGDLVESAINGMLSALDPHSSYLSKKSYQDMQVQTRGEFGGLGIEVTMEKGVVKVIAPIDETPAARAGIKAGDLITQLDGDQIRGLTLSQAVEKMRGPINSPIILTVVREGEEEPLEIRVVRDIIKIRSVRSRAEDDVAYVRITSFNEQTQIGLEKAVAKLAKEIGSKLKGFVIDLRNNPGGLLDQAISVSNAFLERGEIVRTRGRNKVDSQRHNARAGDITGGKPIVVLINGGSASASEIVAGALQDHKRATIIGTRSFGKGSVQTIIPLGGEGGAMRLTTARYYTPLGRSIQAKGIDPDKIVEQETPKTAKKAPKTRGEADLRGHLVNEAKNGDKREESGSSAFVPVKKEDDKQLAFALNLLRVGKVSATGSPIIEKAAVTD
ncbi:MAG: S41 family peptidase, partial [Alphaproteobacteria bacterium]